ncbi:MAG: cytochrome-c peroxidase [Gammaproteobacteria bacterium]|nr:MAG: cytochrome-c peroxidase [Gammaproteobacteria bacterium]
MPFLFMLLFMVTTSANAGDALLERAQSLFKPIPDAPPPLKDNPLTEEKIALGKMLYFDPRLSASWLISCNTCHNMGLGGVDLQETSIGHGWQKGPRNAPTVFNAVFNIAQFWDGRAKDLEEQAKGPIQAAVEMSNTPERLLATLRSMPEYTALFKKAFPDEDDPLTFDNVAKAIEAFEATLITPDAPFDRYLKGETAALSPLQKEGLRLFMDKGCASCHNGVNIGGNGYYPFGVVERPGTEILPPDDKGRFAVTRTPSDEYVFKAPSLRNIELTPPYFHSGKVWSLKQAVAVMGSAQLGILLKDEETEAIAAFLKSLTGRQPEVTYPILPPITENTLPPEIRPSLKGNH